MVAKTKKPKKLREVLPGARALKVRGIKTYTGTTTYEDDAGVYPAQAFRFEGAPKGYAEESSETIYVYREAGGEYRVVSDIQNTAHPTPAQALAEVKRRGRAFMLYIKKA